MTNHIDWHQKLRSRLRKALLKQLTQKNDKTEDLLGISFE